MPKGTKLGGQVGERPSVPDVFKAGPSLAVVEPVAVRQVARP